MILLHPAGNRAGTSSREIGVLRKIFKIPSSQRMAMKVHRRRQPYIHRFFSHSAPTASPNLAHNSRSKELASSISRARQFLPPGRAVLENRIDSLFLNRRGNIAVKSGWMAVRGDRLSLLVKDGVGIRRLPQCRKGRARTVTTQRAASSSGEKLFPIRFQWHRCSRRLRPHLRGSELQHRDSLGSSGTAEPPAGARNSILPLLQSLIPRQFSVWKTEISSPTRTQATISV